MTTQAFSKTTIRNSPKVSAVQVYTNNGNGKCTKRSESENIIYTHAYLIELYLMRLSSNDPHLIISKTCPLFIRYHSQKRIFYFK